MQPQSIIRRVTTLLLTLAFLGATQVTLAAAGKVLFVAGSVTLERKGTRALKVGDPLDLGDVVATGAQSRAQILMADGARIALRANSRFRIDELALPSNVQQPAMAVAVAESGKSVATLLKGGFSTRDGTVGKNNPSGYEVRTPIGTLGIRGTYYTAVFCRGDCADAPGLPPGQPIADGLYVVVDEGTITFNGRGLSLALTAPRVEFIPLETTDPQQLADPPAFLRNDGAGRLEAAGRPLPIAAATAPLSALNDRRDPADAPDRGPVRNIKAASSSDAADTAGDSSDKASGDVPPDRSIQAQSVLGRTVDLIDPQQPLATQTSVAAAVPTTQTPFTTATTQPADTLVFNGGGSLTGFDAPFGAGAGAPLGTYASGTAALVDAGSNGASGLRWGRWSTGSATATTASGTQTLNLANASLHWIAGPVFELVPVLPVSGTTNFVLAGGTSPTDTGGRVGVLNGAVLAADFTAQQVSTTLSLDINGVNWLASGTGPITAGTVRFGGTFNGVLIDGRVPGSGEFSGFFSAGPTTPDQLSGVGLSYQLRDSLQQLGTVSGVAAFVPGTGQAPQAPAVFRDVAYSVGTFAGSSYSTGSATDTAAQLSVDASGNLTSFFAPITSRGAGTIGIGTASTANTGANAATGIRWGRWQNGVVNVTVPPSPTTTSDLGSGSLHWIAGTGYGAAPAIPQTGTASYTLVGNTDPTDTLGNVGTLGAASFSADFTARTVSSALSLTIGGHGWFVSGTGTFGANSTLFSGTYNQVGVDNLIDGQGSFSGFFTVPRIGGGTVPGAAISYSVLDSPAGLGTVSGVLALQQGNGNPLTPPPLQPRDIAWVVPAPNFGGTLVRTMAGTDYALDSAFSLAKFLGLDDSDPGQPTNFDLGTSSVAETSSDSLIMMRWGRWSGGNATLTVVANGNVSQLDLTQRSLHWVESADSPTPPVIPTTGTITYLLAGATAPTDRIGNVGTLNSASLIADFTSQLVTSTLDISVGGRNWTALGIGPIGAQAGVLSHQFAGVYTSGTDPDGFTPSGQFSGFFTNPGGVPGVPAGAALTYTLETSPFSNLPQFVDGAAVFRKP